MIHVIWFPRTQSLPTKANVNRIFYPIRSTKEVERGQIIKPLWARSEGKNHYMENYELRELLVNASRVKMKIHIFSLKLYLSPFSEGKKTLLIFALGKYVWSDDNAQRMSRKFLFFFYPCRKIDNLCYGVNGIKMLLA